MANFTALKTAINNAIKTNGNEEITGAILQAILDAMVETLGDSAINDLENAITTEVTNRENAVGGVADDLAAEALARANKDNQLDGRINQEEYNRANADAALSRTVDQGFQTLNSQMTALNAAISALNAAYQNGYLYGGIATPSSSPSNNKCFYIALQGGTYTNFGGVGVVEGINILKNDSGWKVEHIYDQTTLLNEFYLLRQQVIQVITSFAPIVIEGDVTNAPDEEDLTSNANHLLQFKNNAYSPLEFSGLGRKYLRKNIAPLSESAPFNGFVEGVTAEETLSGTPTQIFWDRMNTRFVGVKDGVYYLDWTDSDNYVPVSTSLVYMYNGTPYQWTGSDFIVDETEVPNLVNCLTQDMINEANTIYIIRYDYTLKENITIPANCVLQFDGGSISFGSYTLSGTILNTVVYQSWFKTIDDFFKFINNVDGPVRYEFTPGEHTASTKVNKNVDSAITIEGNGAKINWTPTVANSLGTVFDIHPRGYDDDTLYPSINIPAAINSGDQTFTVADASGFAVGDVLALKDNQTSSFFWSRNYQEGEYVKIQKIDGTTITVDKPITGDYINVGYLKATKAPLKKCIINNLHLNQTEGQNIVTRGLYVFLMNGEMNNVSVTNFQYNIEAWCCWNFNVNNCFAANSEINYNDGTTDGYALCVNNCQNMKVFGGRFTGKNHGVATGGYYVGKYAIINRFIIYENIETANTVAGGHTDSIDAHDDSDYITVKNCVASGIALGGKHHTVTNCKCYRIAIAAGNSFEHTITDNIVEYEIEVQMYDHSGSYEYAYGNTKDIDHNESLLVYGNICGTIIIQNRCTESRYDMTKLNVYVKNNVMRNGRSHCYFNLTSTISSTDLDNSASIVLVDNIVDTNSLVFQISCNSALLLDNKINAKQFITIINTVAIENCFITTTNNLKPYLYKSIRIVRSHFSADYLNMDIAKNTVTDIVVEDCIFENTNSYYAIRCTSEMNDTNTNIRCVRNFVKGNVANILRIDKVSSVTGGTKTLIFYNNKKNNGEDAGIDNQISTDLVQNIAIGQMRWNGTKPEWWNGTAWVDATGATV